MAKNIDNPTPGTYTLPFMPRAAQKIIMARLQRTRFLTAICHRRLGKTLLAVYYLVTEGLAAYPVYGIEDYRGYYFGPTQKSAKKVAWHYFKKLTAPLKQAGIVDYRETELEVLLPNNGVITLAGSENIEAHRGIYIDRVVVDELASWLNALYAWFEVLRPALADRPGRGMIIGTVKGLDLLYEFYIRGISQDALDSDFDAVKLPASITGIIDAKELAELKHSMTQEAFEREMECNFFAENPEVLITPREVREAMTRQLTYGQLRSSRQMRPVLGCDIGRTGDPSVVYKRHGLVAKRVLKTHDPDNMSVADKISRLIKIEKPGTVFVDAGQGQGVIDRLYRLGHEDVVVEVPFNGESPEKAAVNMRAAMYYRAKKWLARGQLEEDPELLKELVNQELDEDPNNRVKLVRKQKIKARIGRSPDDSDAFALTFADETVDDIEDEDTRKRNAIQALMEESGVDYRDPERSYDPMEYMENLVAGTPDEDAMDFFENLNKNP